MERNLALRLGGAALALLIGVGGFSAGATPLVMPAAHMRPPRIPRPPGPRPEPPRPEVATAKPPPSQFHGLMAQDQSAVRTRLGDPDVARGEGSGAMWTYRLPDCALFIFFHAPKGTVPETGARVSGAASGPRVRGQRPLPVNECIAEAMTRRASGAPSGAL